MAHNFRETWGNALASVDEAVHTLTKLSLSPGGREFLGNLERGEAGLCLELLDRGLSKHSFDQSTRQSLLIVLIDLAKHRRRLPDSIAITDKTMAGEKVHTSGGLWEIRPGTLGGSAIAVKTPKFTATTDIEKIRERFCREVILWNSLSHPNVLKLTGVLGSIDTSNFSTVSEWMTHGTITKYTKTSNVNRLELLHGVAQGLKYMHDTNIIHGNIKANNILITNESPPRACLSGFGSISSPGQELSASEAAEATEGVKWRYLAPELIHPSKFGLTCAKPSRETDVYGFALLVLEVLTGKVPFDGTKGLHLVCSIVDGTRPTRPENSTMIGLSDSLWDLLQDCWNGDRSRRPQMQDVEAQIGDAAARWKTPMPPRRRPAPPSRRPLDSFPITVMTSPRPSSTETVNSSASDLPRSNTPDIRIDVVGPGESDPGSMQEIYPTPSPISPSLGSQSSEALINRLDGLLERGSVADQERARTLNRLCKLCYRHQSVPESAQIEDCYKESMTNPVYCGEFASVFQGSYQKCTVAVKVVRLCYSNHEVTLRKFCKEAMIWRHLRHPNILPLVGVTLSQGQCSMVSNWMENGTINQFIESDQDANRIDLLSDVVNGLVYTHSFHVVHGDLKGENVLVNRDRRACLADFGLSAVVSLDTHLDPNISVANQRESLMSLIYGGSYPWMSPELLDFDACEHRPTKESDIYALGMLIYEVLCGSVPFGHLANPAEIVVEVSKGTRPKKPEDAANFGFTDRLWGIVERCWSAEKDARPTLEAVLSCLREAAPNWEDRWHIVG